MLELGRQMEIGVYAGMSTGGLTASTAPPTFLTSSNKGIRSRTPDPKGSGAGEGLDKTGGGAATRTHYHNSGLLSELDESHPRPRAGKVSPRLLCCNLRAAIHGVPVGQTALVP